MNKEKIEVEELEEDREMTAKEMLEAFLKHMQSKTEYGYRIGDSVLLQKIFCSIYRKREKKDGFMDCSQCPLFDADYNQCVAMNGDIAIAVKKLKNHKSMDEIDWDRVDVDTKLMVRTEKDTLWHRAYFATTAERDGKLCVYVFADGRDSWTTNGHDYGGYGNMTVRVADARICKVQR